MTPIHRALEGLAFPPIELYNPEVPWLACQRGWDEAGALMMLELATRWELCTDVGDWPHLASCLAVVALTWMSIAGWNNSSGTRMLTGTASWSLACHPKKWALTDVCFSSCCKLSFINQGSSGRFYSEGAVALACASFQQRVTPPKKQKMEEVTSYVATVGSDKAYLSVS